MSLDYNFSDSDQTYMYTTLEQNKELLWGLQYLDLSFKVRRELRRSEFDHKQLGITVLFTYLVHLDVDSYITSLIHHCD